MKPHPAATSMSAIRTNLFMFPESSRHHTPRSSSLTPSLA